MKRRNFISNNMLGALIPGAYTSATLSNQQHGKPADSTDNQDEVIIERLAEQFHYIGAPVSRLQRYVQQHAVAR